MQKTFEQFQMIQVENTMKDNLHLEHVLQVVVLTRTSIVNISLQINWVSLIKTNSNKLISLMKAMPLAKTKGNHNKPSQIDFLLNSQMKQINFSQNR